MKCFITTSILTLLAAGVFAHPLAASSVDPTLLAGWSVNQVYRLAVDGDDNVYANEKSGVMQFDSDGVEMNSWTGCGAGGGLAVGPDGSIYVTIWSGLRVHRYDPVAGCNAAWSTAGPDGETFQDATGLAVDALGHVYVSDLELRRLVKLDADGTYLQHWDLGPPVGGDAYFSGDIAISSEGMVYVADGPVIRRFDTSGGTYPHLPAWLPGGGQPYVGGLAVDDRGYLYATHFGSAKISVYSPAGALIAQLNCSSSREAGQLYEAGDVAVNSAGELYVCGRGNVVHKYGPVGAAQPPAREASVFLHISEPGRTATCDTPPAEASGVATAAPIDPAIGSTYRVYLVGSPDLFVGGGFVGLSGFQFGIEYDEAAGPRRGIEIFGWTQCALLDFPQDGWPASGTGNTIAWGEGVWCQEREYVVGGYFDLNVYSSSTMSIVGFPPTGLVKIGNCFGGETVIEQAIAPIRLGWVAFNDGAERGSLGGCNPLLEPCGSPVSATRTTWGRLKTVYK